ncbi:semaphorin-6C [Puma concolor]|uniref:Semaphorin-6C n=1 Tax=Puma concolor TaxID=9696 RepID=A0A6P6I7H6_PUMCO|nr:semaphorin-6C [Puma concolor]
MPRAPRFMPLLLLLLSLPHTQAAFPQDPLPLLTSDLQGTSPLSWFRGLEDDAVVAELGLDFQRFLTLNRTLLVAARDHVFSFDLQAQEAGEGLVPNKYLTWRSQDMENCVVRGKLTDECHNYIRVLVPWDSQTLLACGTNSFSPVCRSYGITSLQQEGEELSGQARCPFDATQSNVAIFAEGSLYSATAADFQASDAVVYRSLGPQPPLRSAKYDSKWLREPHFVHALEHGDHVYFFFREVSVEDARLGRVQFSRVARVCKRDMGGSPRALDRHWTSFLKLRLNCSVPGDSTFYFDVLQALTGPVNLYGRSALFGVFTTQTNSIPGSAVCAFYLDDIEHAFEGKFKEQRSLDGAWTPVSEDRVPSPRPGSCAGVGVAALFPSSRDLPDDVLTFIKAHPLLDPAVPPATHQPLLTLTSRGPSLLPRECGPPLRLDVPPEGKCAAPSTRPALSAPAPRLGVGGGRRTPFPTHRAPPALLTRVPSGGPSRYCGGPGRHLLYLGRPEGYRGRALKRVDVEKPQLPPKPPLVAPSPPPAIPNGSHFHF